MHMRIDERRSEHEAGRVDDAVPVRVDLFARSAVITPLSMRTSSDRVDSLHRIEHARAAEDDVVALALLRPEHHATSAAASARTPVGPPVRTS